MVIDNFNKPKEIKARRKQYEEITFYEGKLASLYPTDMKEARHAFGHEVSTPSLSTGNSYGYGMLSVTLID